MQSNDIATCFQIMNTIQSLNRINAMKSSPVMMDPSMDNAISLAIVYGQSKSLFNVFFLQSIKFSPENKINVRKYSRFLNLK